MIPKTTINNGLRRNAFSLVELLIVVSIIGILAVIAVPKFLNAQLRAQVARVFGDFSAVGRAVEMHRADFGKVPLDLSGGSLPPLGGFPMFPLEQASMLTTPVAYLSSIPQGPWKNMTELNKSDPSAREMRLRPEEAESTLLRGNHYHYKPLLMRCCEQSDNLPGWELSSPGPAHQTPNYVFSYTPKNWYNPTNGAVSDGVLHYESSGKTSL